MSFERVRFTGAPVDPSGIRAVIFDFDGVMTNNMVYVDQNGVETVRCSRGDGMGIGRLVAAGVFVGVLSKEVNPVVGARCKKLRIPFRQGIDDKVAELAAWMTAEGIPQSAVAFVGNDINDLECLAWSALGIAVADAEPEVLTATRIHTLRPGGNGAVRDICEWIIAARS